MLYAHAGVMTAGFLTMMAGLLIARYMRQKRWWLKAHRALEAFTCGAVVMGVVLAILLVERWGGFHLVGIHAYLGAAVAFLIVVNGAIGVLQLLWKKGGPRLRPVHRRIGQVVSILFIFNIYFGLSLAGIL